MIAVPWRRQRIQVTIRCRCGPLVTRTPAAAPRTSHRQRVRPGVAGLQVRVPIAAAGLQHNAVASRAS